MDNEMVQKDVQLWTVEEFAEWMRVTPMAVRCMLRRRELPEGAVIKIRRRVRIDSGLVKEWVLKGHAA